MSNEPTPLESAVKQRINRSVYMDVLAGLAGTVQLDEKTRSVIFGLVLGEMGAESSARAARPWQYLSALLLLLLVGVIVYTYNLLMMIAFGVI